MKIRRLGREKGVLVCGVVYIILRGLNFIWL